MRSRRSSQEHVAEVARRRLELLSAELAAIRPDPVDPPVPGHRDGSGELFEPLEPREPVAAAPARPADEPAPAAGPGRHAHRPVGVGASVAGWAQDRLPPTVQGRVQLTGAHLAVVVAVVVAGVAVTAWWTTRASGGETALPPVPAVRSAAAAPAASGSPPAAAPGSAAGTTAPGAAATAPPAGAAASGSPGSEIVVDVTGKVHRPGIATLPQGSRVADALQAAGGPRRGASLASLNLARVLADGEQVVVGVRAPPGVAASAAGAGAGTAVGGAAGGAATPGTMVNINTADQTLLESLPGVGPVTARSILDYRAEKGGFTSVDELLEVSGIGDATLAKISPYCTL